MKIEIDEHYIQKLLDEDGRYMNTGGIADIFYNSTIKNRVKDLLANKIATELFSQRKAKVNINDKELQKSVLSKLANKIIEESSYFMKEQRGN